MPYEFLVKYANGKGYLYANVIGRVERYEKPKELSEFNNLKGETIKRAYQSWGYINV